MRKAVVISGTNHYEERMRSVIEEYQKEYEVSYLVSDFDHVTKQRYEIDLPNAIQLHVMEYHKNLSPARILSHMMFSWKTYWQLCQIKPDTIYVEIPFNTLATATKWYKRFHKCELVMDIFDMWPESLPIKSENILFKMACAVWRGFRNRNLKYADHVYTECNYYQELIQEQGCDVPMETKYLTRKKVDVDIQAKWDEEFIHICYVGHINNIIDIPFITEFLEKINEKKRVCFHLIGNGESRMQLIDSLESKGIKVITYGVVYDVYRLQEILNQCSFGINFLREGLAIGLTMKSITYLRAGMPLLNAVDGDTWKFVEEHQVGYNIPREEMDTVVEKVLDMNQEKLMQMKNRARKIFEEQFAEE